MMLDNAENPIVRGDFSVSPKKKPDKFAMLLEIIARLRGSGGCPWDRQQTHASLKPYLLEECYEVLQALEEGSKELCEELGDLLLQIVLHAQIAAEQKEFDIEDVVQGICTKLIRRHPHVFGKTKVNDVREVMLNWETLKQQEREEDSSLLAGLPQGMPALAYSQSIQRRVAQAGFDWDDLNGVVEKIAEEVAEVKQASTHEQKTAELGDLLFSIANAARWLDVDLETALRSANQRFFQRFSYMEKACHQRGLPLGNLSASEQNALWEEAKRKLSG